MKIWKIILICISVTLTAGYLIFALVFIPKTDTMICTGINVEILDADSKQFVSDKEIKQLIDSRNPHIIGKSSLTLILPKLKKLQKSIQW